MAYAFKYRLQFPPRPTTDGSSGVRHDLYAVVSEDGGPWELVPGRHVYVYVPASTLSGALSTGTNAEKAAAYKQALSDYLNVDPIPVTGWGAAELQALMEANDASIAAAGLADGFIAVVKPSGYPVDFSV